MVSKKNYNRQNYEGDMLEQIVFDVLTRHYGNYFKRDFRTKKPRYQIDIVKYETESKMLQKMCFLFKPVRFYEIKKTDDLIAQKEVADIYAKSRVLHIRPDKFTVITNGRYSSNIYEFIKTFPKKEQIGLIDGNGLAKLIRSCLGKKATIAHKNYIPLDKLKIIHENYF